MSVAFDIATLMQSLGIATIGTNLGVNAFLDKADNESAVFEYSGMNDDTQHGCVVTFENPRVQVQVRDVSSSAAYTRCLAIYTQLRALMDQTINSHTYLRIWGISSPHLLTRDEKNRRTFICEFQLQRRPE